MFLCDFTLPVDVQGFVFNLLWRNNIKKFVELQLTEQIENYRLFFLLLNVILNFNMMESCDFQNPTIL